MTWKGGFTGTGYTRAEFKAFLRSQPKPKYPQFFVAHNTDAPYMVPSVAPGTRIKNLGNYYKNDLHWSTGPNLVVIGDRVYTGTPLEFPWTNSPGWNGKCIGVEVEGAYKKGSHDPLTGQGLINWTTASWVFAELLEWYSYPIDGLHIKLHKEDPSTTHDCPGSLVTKAWLLDLIYKAEGQVAPETPVAPKPVAPKPLDAKVLDIQTLLLAAGFNPGPLDGLKGPKTDAAIKAFQKSKGLKIDGIVGPITYGALTAKAPEAPKPVEPKPVEPKAPQPTNSLIKDLEPSVFVQDWFKRIEGKGKPGKPFEAYDDRGTIAIGYGHNASSGRPPFPKLGDKITEAEADQILLDDLEAIKLEVLKVLGPTVKLYQHEFDALLLDCYQRGQTQFTKTSAVQAIKDENMDDARDAMYAQANATKDAGLKNRRLVEAQIFEGLKPTKW